ncbi:hypothetical protein BH11MYX4_BH11MYX4_32490 [soil metagenome]
MAPSRDAFRSPAGLVAVAISVVTLLTVLSRMRYGIDFSDEAFYLALPVRFALGDRPFVDELNIAQTAGLLIYPFVRVYMAIAGTTGIFFFIRVLYVVFFGLVGWSAYGLARTRLSPPASLLVGTACVCFIPYGLPGLSYNTLSMGLFAVGLFVVARWLLTDVPRQSVARSPMFWAGVAHAAACFAYASLLLAVGTTALAIVVLADRERVRATLLYAAGGAAFCVLVSPLFLAAGGAHLREMLAYSGGSSVTAAFTAAGVSAKLTAFLAQYPQLPFAAFIAAVSMTVARRYPLLTAIAVCFLPLLGRGSLLVGVHGSLGFGSCFALLGPILSLGLRDRRSARVLFGAVTLPSLVAGAVSGLSSGNGVTAVGLGMYPGMILTAMILAMFIDETLKAGGWPMLRPYLALSPAVVLWVLLGYITAEDGIYRDGLRAELTAKVTEGPYKGLYTVPMKREFLRTMTADIATYAHGERALFIYDLPIGYLIANRRPLVTSAWIFTLPSRIEPDARYFRSHAKSGDFVIVDHPQPRMPLDRDVLERSELVASRNVGIWRYTAYVVR